MTHKDEISRIKAERAKAIALANAMIRDMINETFTPEDIANLARHRAFIDVATGTVPWEEAPPDVMAKFVRQPTAPEEEFTALLNETRKGKK